MTNVVGNSTSLHSLELKSGLLNPVQCPTYIWSSSFILSSFLASVCMTLLPLVNVLESESEGIGVHKGREFAGEFPVDPSCQQHSTYPCASSCGWGTPCCWHCRKKRKRWCYNAGEDVAPFLTSLHPLCCRNSSSLSCQLYYLLRAAVQTCSITCTNIWSQKAQQQLWPNKIPQTESEFRYCPFKSPLKVWIFSPLLCKSVLPTPPKCQEVLEQ